MKIAGYDAVCFVGALLRDGLIASKRRLLEACSMSLLLLLSAAISAETVTIVSTEFVLERKFSMISQAAAGSEIEVRWVQVDIASDSEISAALNAADMIIIDAPRVDDQTAVQSKTGAFLARTEVPILSINFFNEVRMRPIRIEPENALNLFDYYAGGTAANFQRLALYIQAMLRNEDVSAIPPPIELPVNAIYHPDYEDIVFDSLSAYLQWWEQKYSVSAETRPVIAMEFSSSYIADGQLLMMDMFAEEVRERGGVPVLVYRGNRISGARSARRGGGGRPDIGVPPPPSSSGADGYDVMAEFPNPQNGAVANVPAINDPLVMIDGEMVVDVVIVNVFLGSDTIGRAAWLRAMGVQVMNAVQYRDGNYEQYLEDLAGVSNFGIPNNLTIAEYMGITDPVIITTNEDGEYIPVPEHVDMLIEKAFNLANLASTENSEKTIALFFWNSPPGEHNMGASNMNLPLSIANIADQLRDEGYQIAPISEDLLIDSVPDLLIPFYRSKGIEHTRETESWGFLPLAEYEEWFDTIPEGVKSLVNEEFGAAEESHWIIERDGEQGFLIPRLELGNLLLIPQPARSDLPVEEIEELHHDSLVPPHHAYLATYLWVRENMGADAIIHLGTHGSQEWLPGKERGLWAYDYPNLLVENVPVLYPYIVDNMSEAMHVKRRGRGVIISHQTPPFSPAGLSDDFVDIHEMIREYHAVDTGLVKENARELIIDQAMTMNIHLDLDWSEERVNNDFGEFLHETEEYLEILGMAMQPLGMHTFGETALDDHLTSNVMQILGEPLVQALGFETVGEVFSVDYETLKETAPFRFVKDHILEGLPLPVSNVELEQLQMDGLQHLKNLSAQGEVEAIVSGLEAKWVDPSYGGDPIRNPDSLPTGRNMYGFDPERIPTKSAWAAGQEALLGLIDNHQEQYQAFPNKLAFAMRSTETVRHLGMLEGQVFDAIGVRPVWDSGGRVTQMELVPLEELGRPRMDVVISITGLYRDQYPIVMERFNEAIQLAAEADEPEEMNFIRANTLRIRGDLLAAGLDDTDAYNASLTRVFGTQSGDYGTGLPEATLMSEQWEVEDGQLAELYLARMSWSYGPDTSLWSRKLTTEDGTPLNVYAEQLKGTSAIVMSRSSNLRGLLDTDHSFEYLGGISLAVQHIDGSAPQMYISNMRDPQRARLQRAEQFLATELRAVYQHPNWVKEMEAEGYAGTLELLNTINNFWGWQVMDSNVVRDDQWDEFHATYVMDRYDLGVREWFEEVNPEALAQISERMLEAARKEYWDASEQTLRELTETYMALAETHDVFSANENFKEYLAELATGFGLQTSTDNAPADAPQSAEPVAGVTEVVQGQVLDQVAPPPTAPQKFPLWLYILLGIFLAGIAYRDWESRKLERLSILED